MMKILGVVLLFVLSVNILSGQVRCDTVDDQMFIVTEVMPKANISEIELENLLNSLIDLSNYKQFNGMIVYVNFIINCKGEDFDYKIIESTINKELEQKLILTIQSNVKWTPAKQRKKYVDVNKTIKIQIDSGKFNIEGFE